MGLNIEEINIGGNKWLKYKGAEGQDVYVAMFMIDQNKLLGKFVDESSYDLLVDEDADIEMDDEKMEIFDRGDNLDRDFIKRLHHYHHFLLKLLQLLLQIVILVV